MRQSMKSSRRPSLFIMSSMASMLMHSCSSFSPIPSHRPLPTFSVISSKSLAASSASSDTSSPLHSFYSTLNNFYDSTQLSIKCPFIRRRVADCLDGTAMLIQFLLIRHKSLGLTDSTLFRIPGCLPTGRHIKTAEKNLHLSLTEIENRIIKDWNGCQHGKGYYITGRLDTTIYRDDCLFTGPDPDMPVRGLRKYLSAAAQLFEFKHSFAELQSVSVDESGGERQCGVVTVQWTLGGVINLPWHPVVEPWTGWTKYHVDDKGLICLHEEGWDEEVWRIFIGVLFPMIRWVDIVF